MTLCLKTCLRSSLPKHTKITIIQRCRYSNSILRRQSHMGSFYQSSLLEPCSYLTGPSFRNHALLYKITYQLDQTTRLYSKLNQEHIHGGYQVRYCSKKVDKPESDEKEKPEGKLEVEAEKKLSLMQRFKQMYRDYWYVLVPVHLITSTVWFTSFYYLAKSGVDIASILETIGAGENLVQKLRNGNSTMGYIAISYALYKIATPVRYTVTLGGTTISIKYLKDWGYIKPIPPRDKLKEIMHEKKDILLEKKDNLKELYKEKGFFDKLLTKLKIKKSDGDKG